MGQHWFSAKWLKCPLSSRCFAQPSSPWALTQRRRRLLNGKIRAVAVTRHILVRRNIGFLRTQRSRAWKGSNYIISLKILLACWKSGIEIWMDPDLQCSASLLSVLIIDGFVCYMYLSSCASNPLLQSQKARALFKGRKLVGFGPFGGGQLWKYEILKDLEDLDAQYTFGTFGMEHGSMMVSKFDAWIELLSNQVIKTVEEYFYGDCKLGLPAWRISMAPCCFRFVPDMRSLLDKFYEKQKVSSKSRREKSRQHCQLQPVAWKVSKRINFPAINFPMKHQEISGVFSQASDFPFHEGLQIRKSRNSLQNWGRQHVTSSFEAARFEDQKKVVVWSMEQHFDCQENARAGVLKFRDTGPAARDNSFSVSLSVHFCAFCTLLQSSWNDISQLGDRKTMNTQMNQDPKDWHVKGRCHMWPDHAHPALQDPTGSSMHANVEVSDICSSQDLSQSYRFEAAFDTAGYQGARIKPTSRRLCEYGRWITWRVFNGFHTYCHQNSHEYPIYSYTFHIHSSFYGFYVFTYSHSPCVTHIWPWSFPVLQSMTKLTSLSHNLPISRRSTFHQHVPCLAMPNRTRACSCSWKLCAAEQPCLESSWCNCSDFKRQVYWVDCFVMFWLRLY